MEKSAKRDAKNEKTNVKDEKEAKKGKIIVMIPDYNEQATIAKVIQEIPRYINNLHLEDIQYKVRNLELEVNYERI